MGHNSSTLSLPPKQSMQQPAYGNPGKNYLAEGFSLGEENAICSVDRVFKASVCTSTEEKKASVHARKILRQEKNKAGSKAKVATFVHASFLLDQKLGFGVFDES